MYLTKNGFIKKVISIFLFFVVTLSLIYIFFISFIQINDKYKENVIINYIYQKQIYNLINTNKDDFIKNNNIEYITNFYKIRVKKKNGLCIINNIKEIDNKGNIESNNNRKFILCYQKKKYDVLIEFDKEYFILKNYLYIILISLLFLIVIIISDPYFIINKNTKGLFFLNLLKTGLFDKNNITHIEIAIKNDKIKKVLNLFFIKITEHKYDIDKIILLIKTIPYIIFLDKDINNYFIYKEFFYKISKLYEEIGIPEIKVLIYFIVKKIDTEYYFVEGKYFKWAGLLINLISSKYYTSGMQLLIFIITFSILNAFFLGIIIGSNDFFSNLYETVPILSNLGGNVNFTNIIGYLYGIYLQIIGVIYFGMLVNIIGKKISIQ